MLVVSDTTNVFVPLPSDSFMVPYSQSKSVVDALLDRLPELFSSTRATHSALAPAVQASSLSLQQVGGGRAVMFWTGLEGGGAVAKRREDLKLVGTDKEKTLYHVRNQELKKLASECVTQGASIDLFLCMSSIAQPADVASLTSISTTTGGNMHYYPSFQADRDAERMGGEMRRLVTRPGGYDAIARVRTSRGLTVVDYVGSCRPTNAHDVEFAAVDCDKTIAVNLKHDDKLDEKTDSILQFAMLYPIFIIIFFPSKKYFDLT